MAIPQGEVATITPLDNASKSFHPHLTDASKALSPYISAGAKRVFPVGSAGDADEAATQASACAKLDTF